MAVIRGARGLLGCAPRLRHLSAMLAGVALLCLLPLTTAAPTRASSGGAGLAGAPTRGRHRTAQHQRRARDHRRPTRTRPRMGAHRRSPPHRPALTRPLDGRAMWIWDLALSGDGSPTVIADTARRYRVTTVLVKSSDGPDPWSQFSAGLVAELHRAGLRVCAWQYVYGDHPVAEAALGAQAKRRGADCLVIDAEAEYQGKYVAAQTYMRDLRRRVGTAYPLALAGFPYVDYHPGFPYSVFLGPGGAQLNMPQMYWRDIGSSVDAVYAHTYADNLIYGRPIFPLGQIYGNPPAHQIVRFRELSRAYGAAGVSWWDWQQADSARWTAISRPAGAIRRVSVQRELAPIGLGASGDLVVWAQEHLVAAGFPSAIDGDFATGTEAAVLAFQRDADLLPDGIVGNDTWRALLRVAPVRVTWRHRGRRTIAEDVAVGGSRGVVRGRVPVTVTLPAPRSASRPARRDEIPAGIGAGEP